MRTCDVCGDNLGLLKFRYKDGFVCKACYEAASRTCTETIRQLDLSELKARCRKTDERAAFEDFEITGRIGNYLLIDSRRKKICIVNNRIQVKDYKKPEIIALEDICYCKISCDGTLPWEELQQAGKKEDGRVTSLGLELILNSGMSPQRIQILSSPVRLKSYAFKRSINFMQLIVEYLQSNHVECRCA